MTDDQKQWIYDDNDQSIGWVMQMGKRKWRGYSTRTGSGCEASSRSGAVAFIEREHKATDISELLERVRECMLRGLTSPEHIEAAEHLMADLAKALTPQDEGETSR